MTYYRMVSILLFLTAMLVSSLAYPLVLYFAKRHNIVDNPDARKLQRVPIPVLGGVVVYAGVVAGMAVLFMFMKELVLIWGFFAMTFLMIIGIWDDIKDLSANLRFLVEICIVLLFIQMTDVYIDSFHGLFGIDSLPSWFSIPFSVICGVGIINAVNMIDGVDGYSSGYGMMACTLFGLCYWTVWSPTMTCMTMIVIGALFPFFMHNVFGQKSRMFIGT